MLAQVPTPQIGGVARACHGQVKGDKILAEQVGFNASIVGLKRHVVYSWVLRRTTDKQAQRQERKACVSACHPHLSRNSLPICDALAISVLPRTQRLSSSRLLAPFEVKYSLRIPRISARFSLSLI